MNNLLPFEPQLLPWTLLNESPTGVRCRYKGGGLGTLLGAALGLVAAATFTAAAQAASVSFSSTAPALGPDDISQLTTAANRTNNVDAGSDDNSVYLDNGRPIQGQTFRTGANANGYQITAVTLRQVTYDTYALVRDITYHVRITNPSGSTLTVLAEETAFVPEDATDCSTCNFPTIGGGGSLGPGSGRYITFTFASPVVLNPNTTYGFDVGGESTGHYWETDGTSNSNGYTGGTAYSSGSGGLGNTSMTERTGDRVFVVALTAPLAPLPPRFHSQPNSVALYEGRTAQFSAIASGSPSLIYQWQKDSANVLNGGNVSGATTDSLTIANIAVGDAGSYTLVVTNSASSGNSVTSAPVTLTVVAPPAPGGYAYAIYTSNALAYWRLNETGNPATNPPAYDYMGGRVGTYGSSSMNGIAGPRPSAFPGFESTNTALQTTANTDQSWVMVPALSLNTNTATFTLWIYPNSDTIFGYSALFYTRRGTTSGVQYTTDNQIGYTWDGSDYDFLSGLRPPANQWSFVAVVIEPTKATLYLGTGGALSNAVNSAPHASVAWGGSGHIGADPDNNVNRTFDGIIDEVAVFNRSLSFDQINSLYGIGRGIVQQVPPTIVVQPVSQALYAGRTARFAASANGSSPLNYQWQKNGADISDGGNNSGAQTSSLTIANVGPGDAGTYTLVVTNLTAPPANSVTSAPATLTLVTPRGKAYEAAVRSANPVAYWRLNETGDPSTNTLAFDYWGSLAGMYSTNAQNGFNGILGPRPSDFPQFETNNTAFQATVGSDAAWVTVPALNLNTNTVTMTAWIYPNVDPITDYAAVFYSRRGSADPGGVGIQYTGDNQIGYTWNNGNQNTWGFLSGLRPPANQWSFVAVVIEPAKATLYLYNTTGQFSTNNAIPHTSEAWDGSALIGADANHLGRLFDGMIDELAVFNYAFTPAQVQNLYNGVVQPSQPRLTATRNPNGTLAISWDQPGMLQSTTAFYGANTVWNPEGTLSPVTVTPTDAARFYRVVVTQ